MSDQSLVCVDCQETFIFTEGELKFYQSKGLSVPKRCKDCRAAKKAKMNKAPAPRQNDSGMPTGIDEMGEAY